jgi:hypothetical protein
VDWKDARAVLAWSAFWVLVILGVAALVLEWQYIDRLFRA